MVSALASASGHYAVVAIPDRTPTLRSKRTLLRPFQRSDVQGRVRCGKDPEIIRMFGGSPDFEKPIEMPLAEANAWYEHVSNDGNPLHWAVEFEGQFIGTARLEDIDGIDRHARYAIGLLDRARLGIGLGEEVTRAVLRYGFGDLELHRVDLRVLADNIRAIDCYLRCGFVEEGRLRESAFIGGQWHDDVIMGILEHESP
jgi:ribosomal-protein-alanine N-acetyltransferase